MRTQEEGEALHMSISSLRMARRGMALPLVTLGHFALELCNNCMPVIYPLFVSAGWVTYTQVGTITLIASMSASLTQPLFGHLSDRWDARTITALSIGLSAISIGLVGTARAWLLLALWVVLAMIGSAAFHPSGATLASTSVRGARATAVSVFSVGGTIGAACSPLLATAGVRLLGGRPLGTAIILPPALVSALLIYLALRRVPVVGTRTRGSSLQEDTARPHGALLGLALIVGSTLFRMWFQVSMTTYLPTWVQEQGYALEAGARMLFTMTAGTGVGSIIGGALADRIGRWQLMALSLGLLGPAGWALLSAPYPLQIALAGFVGILIGADFPAAIVAAQETWPGGPGVATGLALGLSWIGAGLGGLVTGMLADRFSIALALHWLTVPAAIACLCVLAYPLVTRQATKGPRLSQLP